MAKGGKPVTEPGPPVEPEPPRCNESHGSSCHYHYANGRWALVLDPECPVHSRGPLSNGR